MSDTRAASRYVKSLLGLAVEKNVLDQVHKDMLLFAEVVEQNRSFLLMLNNPVIKHDKKRAILEEIFKGRVNDLTLAIFDIITRKNREPLLPSIAREFHNAYNEYMGIGKASVISATPIDADLRKEFEGIAKKMINKKQIEIVEKVDPSLIGGFILNVGDQQIDASLKSRLNALKVNFAKNPFVKEI
jgi:F-type H+-transporting ATPase subunit delta